MTDVTFLYFEDCPSHDVALARLRDVLREDGIQAEIKIIKVETDEQAKELKFIGSPTILVDGQDIVTPHDAAIVGLACRAYTLEDGRISPLPSYEMIRNGIQRGIASAS